MTDDKAFDLRGPQPRPNCFIQWKGTDVCMDFHCECGAHHHIDSDFVYAVKCHACGTIWEMPQHVYPRKVEGPRKGPVYETKPEEDE